MTLPETIDKKHADRGGWEGVRQIAHDPSLNFDAKRIKIKDSYFVSLDTAARWLKEAKNQ